MIGRTAACLAAILLASASDAAPVAATLDHIAIEVRDLPASVAFYQRLFGLKEIPARVPGPRWLDAGGGLSIHLQPGRTTPLVTTGRTHVALRVADLPAFLDQLTAQKVAWFGRDGEPGRIESRRTDAIRQVFIKDPDGYWIEVNGTLPN